MIKKPLLEPTGKQWLKGIHLTLSTLWLGAAVSMNSLRIAWAPVGPNDLYAVDHAILLIDHWVIIPASFGAVFTGLLESWLTTWGFFKYRWVTTKWMVTVGLMLYAPFFQARWVRGMEAISKVEGLAALQDPVYLQYRQFNLISAIVMIAALLALPIISTLKPWVKRDREKMKARATGAMIGNEDQQMRSGVSTIKL